MRPFSQRFFWWVLLAWALLACPLWGADYSSRISALDRQIQQLEIEKDRALAKMRAGRYCSECKRTDEEIERTGESFASHIQRVKGRVLAADIAAKEREFDQRIAVLRRQREALVQQEREATRQELVRRQQALLAEQQAAAQRRRELARQQEEQAAAEKARKRQQAEAIQRSVTDAFAAQRTARFAREQTREARERATWEARLQEHEAQVAAENARRATLRSQEKPGWEASAPSGPASTGQSAADAAAAARKRLEQSQAQGAQQEQRRLEASKQGLGEFLATFRQSSGLARPSVSVENAMTALFGEARRNAGTTFLQEVGRTSADAIGSEMKSQFAEGRSPGLREAARDARGAVVQDAVVDIYRTVYDQTLGLLPRQEQTTLRTMELPLSWMSLNIEHIRATYRNFVDKEIREPLRRFTPMP